MSENHPLDSKATQIGISIVEENHDVDKIFTLSQEEQDIIASLASDSAILISLNHENLGNSARYLLDGGVIKVGRKVDSDIFLDDLTVSRDHCQFIKTDQGYEIKDGGSLNGIYVNGESVDQQLLKNQDIVQIGKYKFIYFQKS